MSVAYRLWIIVLLAASALCFALAPLLMPDSYSIMTHSISESAAQGVEGAWLARLGFVLFGSSVGALSLAKRGVWSPWARLAHLLFAGFIIGAAIFSHMPWEDIPYDETHDAVHSTMAFGVGMSFTVGVVLVAINPGRASPRRAFDGLAVLTALVIPLVMGNAADFAGLVQRVMFGVAFLWYGVEALADQPETAPKALTSS